MRSSTRCRLAVRGAASRSSRATRAPGNARASIASSARCRGPTLESATRPAARGQALGARRRCSRSSGSAAPRRAPVQVSVTSSSGTRSELAAARAEHARREAAAIQKQDRLLACAPASRASARRAAAEQHAPVGPGRDARADRRSRPAGSGCAVGALGQRRAARAGRSRAS